MKLPAFLIAIVLMATSLQQEAYIEKLLRSPFDLQKFKKAKGQSNSGGADVQPYYFKPAEKGVYFRFFLFRPTESFIYVGDKKHFIKPGFDDFTIITYKPLGKYRDDYFDPTETLIELTTKHNDENLPELAFVGLDTTSIKNKLGEKFTRRDSCFIYHQHKNAVVLKTSGKVVTRVRYSRLNFDLTKKNIPVRLTKFEK